MENNTGELDQVKRERDEAVATAAGLREALEKIKGYGYTRPKRINGRRWGIRTNEQSDVILLAVTALSTPPSAHLERIQREAAAKELERIANEECSIVFAGDLLHITKDNLIARAAELRGAK